MNAPFPLPAGFLPGELIVDSFAGGGGTSEGIRLAVGRDPDIAINHDAIALAMHRINHPGTYHMVEDVWHVDALGMCDGRPIGLLWLSPDCKHFSKAKGGKPREKAIRGLAWVGLRWVKSLPKVQRPRIVILENVEEFQDWGPLLEDGKPCPLQKGATFKAFIGGFASLGYKAEWRELRACDYGDPTIRKRLFVILRRDKLPIVWPARTHGNPKDAADAALIAAGALKPWRTAAEIIDFSLPCPSIFETSAEIKASLGLRAIRPLADNTLSRVAKGTMRYVVNAAKPFIVKVNHTERHEGRARDIDAPLATLTGKRDDALVMPFVAYAQQGGGIRDIGEPLHTITASAKDQNAVVTPFITKFNQGSVGHALDEPLATVTSHASETHGGGAAPLGLVAPILVNTANGKTSGRGPNAWPADEPARTITGAGGQAVVAPFLVPRYQEKPGHDPRTRSVELPSATIMPRGNEGVLAVASLAPAPNEVVTPFLVPRYGERAWQEPRTRSVEEPAPVIVPAGNEGSLAAVRLQRQFGASVGGPVDEPAATVTAGGAGKTAVVAAFLAQHNTDRGDSIKAGRAIEEPVSTITATGGQSAFVAAYLAQHNTGEVGHEAERPLSTIVGKGCTQGLVQASFLSHAYTSNTAGGNGDLERPLKTTLAGGQHAALVAAFLAKYYGAGEPSQAVDEPLHTLTTKPRHGLVTVTMNGEPYVITDIGMRMLTPRERFSAQGFRNDKELLRLEAWLDLNPVSKVMRVKRVEVFSSGSLTEGRRRLADVSARIDCGRAVLELRRAESSDGNAKPAEKSSSVHLPIHLRDFARSFARGDFSKEKQTVTGKEVLHRSDSPSTHRKNGGLSAAKCTNEMVRRVSGVKNLGSTEAESTTSIMLPDTRPFQHYARLWKTLCSFVADATASFILGSISQESSLSVDLEIDDAYVIDHGLLEDGSKVLFTLEQQGRMCGNSVCPGMARALVAANVVARPTIRRARPERAYPLLQAAE